MAKKIVKIFLVLGIILLASWIAISLYQKEIANDKNKQFFMLEINANDRKITIEPHKNKATIDSKELSLEEEKLVDFIVFFNKYFSNIKNLSAKENTKYLWTIKYQDVNLNNFYLGKDEYPTNWNDFAKNVDKLLGSVYLTKKEDMEDEDDLTVKPVTSINFKDTCNAYICNYSLKVNKDTIPLSFKRSPGPNDTYSKQTLILNNKTIISEDFQDGGPLRLKVFKDRIIVLCGYGDGTGEISGYDLNGKELFSYSEVDALYPGMYVALDDFNVDNNYIKFNATRITEDNKIRVNGVSEVLYCDESDMTENEIDSNFIVQVTYKINYVNSRFEDPEVLKTTTLNSSGLLNKCENTSN